MEQYGKKEKMKQKISWIFPTYAGSTKKKEKDDTNEKSYDH